MRVFSIFTSCMPRHVGEDVSSNTENKKPYGSFGVFQRKKVNNIVAEVKALSSSRLDTEKDRVFAGPSSVYARFVELHRRFSGASQPKRRSSETDATTSSDSETKLEDLFQESVDVHGSSFEEAPLISPVEERPEPAQETIAAHGLLIEAPIEENVEEKAEEFVSPIVVKVDECSVEGPVPTQEAVLPLESLVEKLIDPSDEELLVIPQEDVQSATEVIEASMVSITESFIENADEDHDHNSLKEALEHFSDRFYQCTLAHLVMAPFATCKDSRLARKSVRASLLKFPAVRKAAKNTMEQCGMEDLEVEMAWHTPVDMHKIENKALVHEMMWHNDELFQVVDSYLLLQRRKLAAKKNVVVQIRYETLERRKKSLGKY